MIAKKEITDIDRKSIRELSAAGKTVEQITKILNVDGRVVSGIVSAERRRVTISPSRPISPPPLPFPTKEDQIKILRKSWKESEPEAEFSLHTEKGQVVYIACYNGGLVLRVGEQKKVALLTTGMAHRLGGKLIEMAQWSIQRPIPVRR